MATGITKPDIANRKKFDLDLGEGQSGELLIEQLLSGERGTVEVKRDFKVGGTGNLAIEFKCWGKPSGIAVSTALWWALVLDGEGYAHELVFLIKRKRLLDIAKIYFKQGKWVRGGDDKASCMVLIPLKDLVSWKPDKQIQPEMM